MAAAAVSSDPSPRIYTQSQGQTITSTTVTLHPRAVFKPHGKQPDAAPSTAAELLSSCVMTSSPDSKTPGGNVNGVPPGA